MIMALLPVSISIGVLCGLWFFVTTQVVWLVAWVGYAAWASFYYAGGNKDALPKSYAANLAGMVQGAIFFWLWLNFGGGSMLVLSVLIGVFCFVMTIEGNIGLLSAIPGQFVGAAVFFGNFAGHASEKWSLVHVLINTAVCMLIGNLAGLLSAKVPEWFKPKEKVAST
jgi:hypothetical protein